MYHINSQFSIQIGREGLKTSWYENGQKMKETNWKDGEDISSKMWNKDGSVKE